MNLQYDGGSARRHYGDGEEIGVHASSEKLNFADYEIVTIAVYLLGGRSQPVDTEDVAMKVHELMPGLFSWRKYPEQINIERVRVRLSDAKKPRSGGYLQGSGKNGWLLTTEGLSFVERHLPDLSLTQVPRKSMPANERRWMKTERTRILASEAYQRFQSLGDEALTRHNAESFFRVDEYVFGDARKRKISRVVNTFGGDPQLGSAVQAFARLLSLEEGS